MEKAERATAALKRLRDSSKAQLPRVRHDLEAVSAGALAGAVRGAFQATGKEYALPGPNGLKIAPEIPLGGLVLAVAFSGQTEVSDDLHAIGSGILAYSAGREAELFMTKRQKTSTIPPGTAQ